MNEYEILLSYLDNQKNEINKIKSFEDITSKSDTKKIIGECQEENKLDTPRFSNNSVGFDPEKFENLMRSRLIDAHKKTQSYDRPYISVTELLYCLRKTYYTRLKYEIDLKKQFKFAYLDLINEVGNAIHKYVEELYNFTEVEKTIISEKYKTKGRIDAIYDTFLYDIKTLDEKKFSGRFKKEHYFQPIIYSHILNTEYNYNIKTITLVYFFRDNLKRKPYSVDLPVDDKIAISFLEGALLLYNHINEKTVPEPINSDKEQCKWCSYISYCKKDKSKMLKPFQSKEKQKQTEIDISLENVNVEKEEKKEILFLL